MLDISKIIQRPLPEANYVAEDTAKTQIYLHHTAGSASAINVVDGFKTRVDKVATSFVIAGDGTIVQAFSSKKWAYHLGLKKDTFTKFGVPYKALDKTSIGIELCNWGYLTKTDKGFKTYVGTIVPQNDVIELPVEYRGYKFYHRYTDAQLISLKELLMYLCDKYTIPKEYNVNMFSVNKDALLGVPGVWGHGSVRADKWDCSPQNDLIHLLTTLKDNLC